MRIDESQQFNPGLARHRLVIKRPVKTKDDFGADVVTLALYATVYAQIVTLQGREMEAAQQRWAEAKYRIRMQYTPGIEREFTIERPLAAGTVQMDILDVRDAAGTSNCTEIIARDAHAR
jgi:head-tail adaptor